MKRLVAITVALFAFSSLSAEAGKVQINKAKRAAEAKVAEALTKARQVCGNPNLTATIEWGAFDRASDAELKKIGRTRLNVIGIFGGHAANVLGDLATLCKDADYKAEIAKLRAVPLHAVLKAKVVTYKLRGKTLVSRVPMYIGNSWSDSSGLRALKAVF